ncbi:NK-lysin tandem duplicate 4 [Xyrichtys novacula]|uniref:NK-lysin tandem duplicate 4 n=1 Tax=Xyrichtys novacula TaxID=13765 RepID=A0AAV1GHE5_XYRNO|nr:NK-lysin tandem duplicate 4 [Xyrichtys novacula]
MDASSTLLVCLLVTYSVWTVHGASLEIKIDDEEPVEVDMSLPGACWACKWALNKVKKAVGSNATVEVIKSKLLKCCDGIGLLKGLCRKFVKKHLGELIEELTTTDDVRTICVNAGACKQKELLNLHFYQTVEDPSVEVDEYH